MALAPAKMGLWAAETAKTLAFMGKAWLVLVNAVFMLAAFKHRTRQSLKSDLPDVLLVTIFQQPDELFERHAQGKRQPGREEQRGDGLATFDVADHVARDTGAAGQSILFQAHGIACLRQLARQPRADAFGVIIRPLLTNWFCFHTRRSPANPPPKCKREKNLARHYSRTPDF